MTFNQQQQANNSTAIEKMSKCKATNEVRKVVMTQKQLSVFVWDQSTAGPDVKNHRHKTLTQVVFFSSHLLNHTKMF